MKNQNKDHVDKDFHRAETKITFVGSTDERKMIIEDNNAATIQDKKTVESVSIFFLKYKLNRITCTEQIKSGTT